MIRPIQAFEDNIRPAQLMLHVYRLLECGDAITTEGEFIERLREQTDEFELVPVPRSLLNELAAEVADASVTVSRLFGIAAITS